MSQNDRLKEQRVMGSNCNWVRFLLLAIVNTLHIIIIIIIIALKGRI
jgi:hypothetical protein